MYYTFWEDLVSYDWKLTLCNLNKQGLQPTRGINIKFIQYTII